MVAIGSDVLDKKILKGIAQRVLCLHKFCCGGHTERGGGTPATTLEGLLNQILVAICSVVSNKKIFKWLPTGSYVELSSYVMAKVIHVQ